jgi:bifunctional oligoribonuclease and PAP phosphatase NrnA
VIGAASVDVAAKAVLATPRDGEVLLACHVNPDGDALGSMLAFGLGLRQLGFTRVRASFPEPFEVPEAFRLLPGQELLVPPGDAYPEPALGASFDAASPARLGALAEPLSAASTWLMLDHHASNPGFGTVCLLDPGAAATAVLTAELLDDLDVRLDAAIATALYVGVTTDTGSFKFDTTSPQVHRLAARLVEAGARPAEVARDVFDTRPFGALKLLAEVLGRAELDEGAVGGRGLVWAYITVDDLRRHGQRPEVVEGFIDVIRTSAEADVACLLKPAADGAWSVSLRSKGATDVAAVALDLGGGGHRLASGFTVSGTPAEVMARLRRRLDG